jgi:transposase-like protein
MTQALGYSRYDWRNKDSDNSRNGHSKNSVKGRFGDMELAVPRDVKGEFEPVIVKKHERSIGSKMV